MSVCIFLGPSLPEPVAKLHFPQCRFLPPVQHGSIFEAMQRSSLTAIGIIDGYFQHRPSVWHKEILWAMEQGVYVAGASSMGALRAAELAPFGMVGVGKVYKAFEQGAMPPFSGLTDDDEVAIMHGPAETGFVCVTEAMVNVRFTLDAACEAGIIDVSMADALLTEAKSLHFSDRTYPRIYELARQQGIRADSLERLARWLPAGKIDQKREDAIELIEHMANLSTDALSQQGKRFHFERTEIFDDALNSQPTLTEEEMILSDQDHDVLDELRLNKAAYDDVKCMALMKCLLTQQMLPLPFNEPSTNDSSNKRLQQSIDTFRRDNELLDREKIDHWLLENDLQLAELEDLIAGEAQLEATFLEPDKPPVSIALINQLKLKGKYNALAIRARQKREILASQQAVSQAPWQLLNWYFETHCRCAVPADTLLYAQQIGLSDEAELCRLLANEYLYITHM